MTLEEFAHLGGFILKEGPNEWGGTFSYTEKDSHCTTGNFRTAKAAYKHWLESSFDKHLSKAIIKLLKESEKK